MAGRMGQDTVTVKNLEIIEITADGVLLIKGLVPGSVNSIVTVKKMGKNKKFVPLYKEVTEEPAEPSEVPGGIVETVTEEAEAEIPVEVQAESETPAAVEPAGVVQSEAPASEPEPETILAETPAEKAKEQPETPVVEVKPEVEKKGEDK
jgi:hypothetical protein